MVGCALQDEGGKQHTLPCHRRGGCGAVQAHLGTGQSPMSYQSDFNLCGCSVSMQQIGPLELKQGKGVAKLLDAALSSDAAAVEAVVVVGVWAPPAQPQRTLPALTMPPCRSEAKTRGERARAYCKCRVDGCRH